MLRIEELARKDGLLLVFIRIKGCDALLRRTVFPGGKARLFQRVELPVPGQQQGGPVADLQVFRADGDALFTHLLDLLPEVLRVQRYAVSQNVDDAGMKNPGRQQVQGKLAVLIDHRVPGVAAALIADDHVVILCQQVDHAAFSLIAPVDAHNCAVLHGLVLLPYSYSTVAGGLEVMS